MQHHISTIINALGGRDAVQELLGVGASAISNYLARGAFPTRAQPILLAALQARGYRVDPQDLTIHGAVSAPASPMRVLMIIGGGIAAYKALEVARRLQDQGASVTGVMTESAQQFITPLSVSALTGNHVYTDLFSLTDEANMGHIQLARETDLVLAVPATGNLMARMAHGMADDLATTIMLATTAPVAIAPAMNPAMWAHPATQANLDLLRQRGVHIIGPATGDTACGEEGAGRMTEPGQIVASAMDILRPAPRPLAGRHIMVTSGPTIEPIDSVRFIANHSSGKQGHAIARAAAARGAKVTLVSGPVALPDPDGVTVVPVSTAREMLAACEAALPADVAICAAAVADWRVINPASRKLKKEANGTAGTARPPTLELTENPDILAKLAQHENRPELVIGFAAETENLADNARAKRARKQCDWIIANHVDTASDNNVFGSERNAALWLSEDAEESWPEMPKQELAMQIIAKLEEKFAS